MTNCSINSHICSGEAYRGFESPSLRHFPLHPIELRVSALSPTLLLGETVSRLYAQCWFLPRLFITVQGCFLTSNLHRSVAAKVVNAPEIRRNDWVPRKQAIILALAALLLVAALITAVVWAVLLERNRTASPRAASGPDGPELRIYGGLPNSAAYGQPSRGCNVSASDERAPDARGGGHPAGH